MFNLINFQRIKYSKKIKADLEKNKENNNVKFPKEIVKLKTL